MNFVSESEDCREVEFIAGEPTRPEDEPTPQRGVLRLLTDSLIKRSEAAPFAHNSTEEPLGPPPEYADDANFMREVLHAVAGRSAATLPKAIVDAACDGEEATVAAWLDEGGDVNARDETEMMRTLLMTASLWGRERMVMLLLGAGAAAARGCDAPRPDPTSPIPNAWQV